MASGQNCFSDAEKKSTVALGTSKPLNTGNVKTSWAAPMLEAVTVKGNNMCKIHVIFA